MDKNKIELPVIEFEGKQVKPSKRGVYKCPFNCGRSDYAQPSWKTEAGFRKHMQQCPSKPSEVKRRQENKEIEHSAFETIKAEILGSLDIKVGDKVAVVKEWILKPTHELRFNRMVRVRYDAVKRFEGLEIVINKIDLQHSSYLDKEYLKGNIIINDEFRLSAICPSIEAAKKRAEENQRSYDAACEFASQCR